MPDRSQPTAPNMVTFTLDSAYAHALLAPREQSMLPRIPPPERTPVIRDINTNFRRK